MIAAYIFTFFVFLLLVLFILLPFLQKNKSTFEEPAAIEDSDDLIVEPDVAETADLSVPQHAVNYDVEIEVAVAKARRAKSTFWNCSACGRRMKDTDQFCASCGKAR